jgi:hypothetical protein
MPTEIVVLYIPFSLEGRAGGSNIRPRLNRYPMLSVFYMNPVDPLLHSPLVQRPREHFGGSDIIG